MTMTNNPTNTTEGVTTRGQAKATKAEQQQPFTHDVDTPPINHHDYDIIERECNQMESVSTQGDQQEDGDIETSESALLLITDKHIANNFTIDTTPVEKEKDDFEEQLKECQRDCRSLRDDINNSPDEDNHDLDVSGWVNLATGKHHLVLCRDDMYEVRGAQWRCRQRFDNWISANKWLAAEKLVPEVTSIQGWHNDRMNCREIVSCRDDLNYIFGKGWKLIRQFNSLVEANWWLRDHSRGDGTEVQAIDLEEDESDDNNEKMLHSFHRDDYGYEYLESQGDKSCRPRKEDTDWNLYTTGPWKRERSMRDGFNRYDNSPMNDWRKKQSPHR